MAHAGACVRLNCRSTTPVAKILDVWPSIPTIIVDYNLKASGVSGICATLERNDRIHEVDLNAIRNSRSEKVLLAMNHSNIIQLSVAGDPSIEYIKDNIVNERLIVTRRPTGFHENTTPRNNRVKKSIGQLSEKIFYVHQWRFTSEI